MICKRMTLPSAVLIVLLTACSSTPAIDPAEAPSASVTESGQPVPEEEPIQETPEPAKEGPSEEPIRQFGDTVAYASGIKVTIGELKPFKPSSTAIYNQKDKRFVQFEVTIKNDSNARYSPNLFTTIGSTGDRDAEQIFDSINGLTGPPNGMILKGRTKKFKVGFGVERGQDLILEVKPDFSTETALFSS